MLAVLAALAVHLHVDAIAADLSARSRAALRAADVTTVEVAFSGREAMVGGHVASDLHLAAVETIIESQRGVRWADLRTVTVGGAASKRSASPALDAPKVLNRKKKVAAVASVAPPSIATRDDAPQPDQGRLDAGSQDAAAADATPTNAARSDAAPTDSVSDAQAGAITDAAPKSDAIITLTWTKDGPVLDGTLPSDAAQANLVKATQAILGDTEWTDRSVVQAGASPPWLPAAIKVLPTLRTVDRLTLQIDLHRISIGGAVVDAATRTQIEARLDAACPRHVVQNRLTIMAPPAQVVARMRAVRGLDLFFGPDGVNLTEDGAAELAQIAVILQAATGAVRIESHTDDVGKRDTNQARSDARAAVIRDALQAHGVASERLHAIGRGADNPIADNSTQDGRAVNRRIVITLDP